MRSAILALLLIATSLPSTAQKAGKVTREVQPASVTSGTKTTEAAVDEGLKFNDILKTGPDGRLRAVLGDGSILTLTSSANMRVVSHDKETGKTELELKYGYVRAAVVGAVAGQPPASFEIHTTTAVCGVLGTHFEMQASDEATQVHVHEGQVHFTNSKTGQRMELRQGQSAHLLHATGVMRQGLYPKFARATRQRWQAEREEIQGERLERNQHRQQRIQEIRKQRAQKKRPAKEEKK
jgi:ferric-dicitrate binding protein FerR (iron transport regulator)